MSNNELKKQAFTGTTWKFLERIAAQGVSLIVSIILARLLAPNDYSATSVVTIFFAFANILISGGLNTALIQKKDADIEDYSAIFWFSLLASILCYSILFVAAPYISILFNSNNLTLIIRIMGLVLPFNAVKGVWCSYISSNFKFRKFFFATFGGTIVSAIVGIIMAMKGFGCWALVWQQMINIIVDTAILVFSTRLKIKFKFNFIKFKQLFKFGWKILLSNFLGTLYTYLSPIAIGIKYNSDDLSFYTKSQMFPTAISSSITQTFSAVLFPVLAKVQKDISKVLNYTRKFMRVSSFIVFPLMLGLFAVSDNFIIVLLTEKWLPAAYYLRIFCIVSMFEIIAIGNCEAIKAIGKSGVYLVMEIIKKISYFSILFLFIFFSKSPNVLVLSQFACLAVQIVVNSVPNKKIIGYNYKAQFKDIFPSLFCSLLMASVVYLCGLFSSGPLALSLIKQVVVGVLFYIVFSIVFNKKTFLYFIKNLKDILFKSREK